MLMSTKLFFNKNIGMARHPIILIYFNYSHTCLHAYLSIPQSDLPIAHLFKKYLMSSRVNDN